MSGDLRCRDALRWVTPLIWFLSNAPVFGDDFTYLDQQGAQQKVSAQLVASAQGIHILARQDGSYQLIPQAAVVTRETKDGPAPYTGQQLAEQLEKEFGADKFRYVVKDPFVMGLVLETPLPKSAEIRAQAILKRGSRFMTSVARIFGEFAKDAQIDVTDPEYPLPILIFETDVEFERYAATVMGAGSVSTARVSGFYSGITNRLAIRLAECLTFDVPLHEAIHQQVYNRGVFQRLAPVPHWFDEGIATGFESNNGKITTSPIKVSARYAKQAVNEDSFNWELMAVDDRVFMGDVLVSEAYGQAWAAHWLLVTKYRSEYRKYLRLLAQKTSLQEDTPEQRLADFESALGRPLQAFEDEFMPAVKAAIKKQKVAMDQPKVAGISRTESGLGRVELSAVRLVDVGDQLQVQGSLANLSPLRNMTYHVTVETDLGTYAEWLVPDLQPQKSISLDQQFVRKAMQNGGFTGGSRSFHVRIRSTPADSETAQTWKEGKLPVPVYQP